MDLRVPIGTLLEDRADASPNKLFITPVEAPDAAVTYGDFNVRANAVAHSLADLGVHAGRFVACMASNSIEYLLVSYALKKLGAVEVLIHPEARGAVLTRALNLTPASILVASTEVVSAVADVAHQLEGKLDTLITIGQCDPVPHVLSGWTSAGFADLASSAQRANPPRCVSEADVASIVFTSGTTGAAKGCQLSHRYAVNCAEQQVRLVGQSEADRLYSLLPFAHVAGAYYDVLGTMLAGAHLVLRPRYSTTHFWADVREHRVTVAGVYGFMAKMLYDRPPTPGDQDHEVRVLGCDVGPIPHREFARRFGIPRMVNAYGSTEAGLPIGDQSDERREGSCGQPYTSLYDVAVVDDYDYPVRTGEVGELVFRPRQPNIMFQGYYGQPEATLSSQSNLWFHSGDLARMDGEDNVYLVGRKKEMIRRRAENVSVYEVEEALYRHPAVADCAAVGVPNDFGDQDVGVAVVLHDGVELEIAALRSYCLKEMPRFMAPDHIQVVGSIPRTPLGKIDRSRLLDFS